MNRLIINPQVTCGHIRAALQGQFSEHLGRCIYGGLYVGESNKDIPNVNGMRCDVVNALREIHIPVLRWPGGCFADEYHWQDGIGPKESRKRMINTHWGGVLEDNSFGTHEFMELCRQLGCDAYINGNVGSGTVREMSEWVEYMTFDGVSPMADERRRNGREEPWQVRYFAVGNEPWGCGGNFTAEQYANEYRRYQTYIRQYHSDHKIYRIACGPSDMNYEWTETMMKIAGNYMDGLSLHYYTVPQTWSHKGAALQFTPEEYYETLKKTLLMDELIRKHGAIMDRYDPQKRVGLIVDEWGTWYDVEEGTNPGFLYQQNAMRDAMVAALNLNIFNKHCDRVHMANIAQLVNVLQAMILTEGDRMVCTPTYYAFKLFSVHQENELLQSVLALDGAKQEYPDIPALQESSSLAPDGTVYITVVNPALEQSQPLRICLNGKAVKSVSVRILTGTADAHNTFDCPDAVQDREFDACTVTDGEISTELPPCSLARFEVR